MASFHKPTSRYIDTPTRDFYLDLWEAQDILPSSNDVKVLIAAKYHQRPDLYSFDLYGTPRLWWVFAMRNKDVLFDPIYDFNSGTEIFIPSRENIEGFV